MHLIEPCFAYDKQNLHGYQAARISNQGKR